MAEVFILLGGNVGDKSKIFNKTTKLIAERAGKIIKRSSIYVTEPWGFESDLFWNQALIISTSLNPYELLIQTQAIEAEMGRIKTSAAYEARKMDIDLLFYDELLIEIPDLKIPHPRIGERKFVLIPLNEIAPEKRHPGTGLTICEMLEICSDTMRVERAG
jgi:2-amino-4-hydroxy-6-hydroxymethyldihydropteridine diphosphokinase